MRVKIGDKIYDTKDQPIMLIFDDDEQRTTAAKHLSQMPEMDAVRKYCIYSSNPPMSEESLREFMKIEE